jgi:hypothetical protein
MALNDAPDWIVPIPFMGLVSRRSFLGSKISFYLPGAMEIVAHQIGPVSILQHVWQIEPPEVPVGRRCCEADTELPWGSIESRAESL